MPKIDIAAAPVFDGTGYPPPFHLQCHGRRRQKLGDAAGLNQFGVNLMRLPDGQWSSQRHWHTAEDEFVWVVEGEVVLVEDGVETVLRAGECAGFPAGAPNGHHLQNRSGKDALLLEVGGRQPATDVCTYPDIDLHLPLEAEGYETKDGKSYGPFAQRTEP
ncbi:cupin domain-containing protein [Caulobacter segnis]|uniref:cupin domain-containing protein n=1 Tax=Caulobacter segnis TaxID=88688 RepID=UPI00240F0223|nr:cupin domain-containing protein [Caulobacter segnis]MDG2520169.1 cupin domain-containing protein [Caulobacter segnis]